MRVITGSARGRRLNELKGYDTRPTTDKVKEGIFSAIQFEVEGARFLVRGARNSMDFDAEYQLSLIYKDVSGGALDTVLLCAEPAHQHISSTMAREMVKYHQPLEKYLPAAAAARIRGKDRG